MRLQIRGRTILQSGVAQLGLQGDRGVETVEFLLPRVYRGTDISEGTALLLYASAQESGFLRLEKEVCGEELLLTWQVNGEATATPGDLEVQLKLSGLEAELWHSEVTRFYVARSLAQASAQAMAATAKRARMANPETEPPITVAERKLLIPKELQSLAVQNDTNSETVIIRLPRFFDGHDFSRYSICLKTVSAAGRDDVLLEQRQLTASEIALPWTLRPPQTSVEGKLALQLMVWGADFMWQTEETSVNILRSLDAEPMIPTTPGIMEAFLREAGAIRDEAARQAEEAERQAGNAATSATKAATASTGAAASAANAKVSEENAKMSETGAAGSLTDINAGLVSKLSISEANQLFKSVTIDDKTGVFTFTRYDNTKLVIDTGLEKVLVNFRLDANTLELILLLADGTEQRVSLVPFLNLYTGGATTTVDVQVNGTVITATVKGNSISLNLLTPDLQNLINSKITANQAGNASQVEFSDGKSMQEKLDAGDLNGKDGVLVEQSGLFYMRVDQFGHLKVGVPDGVSQPPLSIRNGKLIYTIS